MKSYIVYVCYISVTVKKKKCISLIINHHKRVREYLNHALKIERFTKVCFRKSRYKFRTSFTLYTTHTTSIS